MPSTFTVEAIYTVIGAVHICINTNLCNLTYLYLNNNSAIIEFPVFLNNLSGCISLPLQWLDASHSQFVGPPSYKIQTLTNLTHLEMSSCNLGPSFPKWIQTLKNLVYLDISNNGISDTIPMEVWDMWPSQLICMNLSSNNISGKAPDLSLNFDNNSVIDLSSNGFYGQISNVSSTVASLNLSRNKFYGGISFLCQIVHGLLEFLDLSHNSLTGQIPDCLWHFKELKVLNLGHNNLSGRLPPPIGSLIQLEVLDLHKNGLFGELPLSIKNCTNLTTLILGANKFSGNVPVWIGEKLSWLYVLILRSNIFFGTIPLQLCQLPNLQILDLSMNHLHGTIPSCLDNLMSMVQEGLLPTQNVHSYSIEWYYSGGGLYDFQDDEYVDHAMIEWQGDEQEFFRNLVLLKSIDLRCPLSLSHFRCMHRHLLSSNVVKKVSHNKAVTEGVHSNILMTEGVATGGEAARENADRGQLHRRRIFLPRSPPPSAASSGHAIWA
ncbi:unnamed protein product [Lactuca virosa]|uniref:Leucine-rich repeat-containing N-terminal plant-type domain-containing protein n=1 Tax=Lactuca virosa TaxID=75947 RepID=A0AAU9PSN9_9ASTR|nr:unnamed protein product [Lactuca virosa]